VDELTVRLNGPGDITTNFNGQYLVPGDTYSMTATPAANAVFESWSSDGNTSLNPVESFTMSLNLSLTATFISNDIPGSIAFTYPKPGKPAYATNGVLAIQGTITGPASPPVSITCQLFSSNNQQLLGSPLQTSSTNIWSLQTNLPNGQYYVQAIAQDSLGRTTLITNAFSLQTVNKLTVLQNGPGVITTNLDGQYLVAGKTYSMKAKAAKNCVFETWSDGLNATLDPVETFTMSSNLTLTATFVSNGIPGTISFTDPHANAQLTNPVVTLAGRTKSSIAATQIVCQLFLNSNSLAPPSPAGIANDTWSAPQTNLAPGLSSLAPGAYTAVATAYDATGKSALIRENFDVLARLTVAASTNLVVPPVLDTNGVNTNIVTVASPLQAGAVSLKSKYLKVGAPATIRAAPKPGYLFAYWVLNGVANPNNPYSFSLTTNETITANFAPNYYSKVSGTYYGLFYPSYTYATPDNAGYFTMEILSGGATTIDLSFPNYAYKFEGELPYYCGVQPEVTSGLHGSPSDPLIMSFGMDLTNFSGAFTGYVYDAKGTWGANLTAYRAATKLATSSAVAPGRYVLTIPGDHTNANNQPGGDSYAVYSISDSGAVALAGSLADNTTFTRSTGVSTNGIWPLYVPLYNTHGIILGWQTNSSPTNFSGQVEWDKPARTGAYYPSGFTNVFSATPANYTPPAADTHYQIVFNGGALAGPLTNFLTVTSARLFTPDPAQAGLKVTLTPATGAITGQFMDPSGNTVKKIRGAFISPGSGGSGYILDADDETGYFEISLLP
jgi:archaellum component FlaF (FlaF/FlaG flagellin family)